MIGDELTGKALDRAVAEALGFVFAETPATPGKAPDGLSFCREGSTHWCRYPGSLMRPRPGVESPWVCATCHGYPQPYSTDWQHGGPLIERYEIDIIKRQYAPGWMAYRGDHYASGDTPLQAVARCIVVLHRAGALR